MLYPIYQPVLLLLSFLFCRRRGRCFSNISRIDTTRHHLRRVRYKRSKIKVKIDINLLAVVNSLILIFLVSVDLIQQNGADILVDRWKQGRIQLVQVDCVDIISD
jgi:hypothetical protein